jgi:hypothetical protein
VNNNVGTRRNLQWRKNMAKQLMFFAYTAQPQQIGITIEQAIKDANTAMSDRHIKSWKEIDIPGHFIATEVLNEIEQSRILIADISKLNFNVTYEIGYAIGKSKRIALVKNKAIAVSKPTIADVGIFDTIGYFEYENSKELTSFVKGLTSVRPLDIDYPQSTKQPVYLNEAKIKNDWVTTLISRVKKAKLRYRNFDPNEQPRLSAPEAIKQVAQSYGVLVHLLGDVFEDHEKHNIWASFIAGLAHGMGREVTIIQNGYDPIPIDYRDAAKTTTFPSEIYEIVNDFAAAVTEAWQAAYAPVIKEYATFLERLELGASSAENELRMLRDYYLETDEFRRAARGEVRLVVGRKGSGKTAIFFQIRDRERSSKKKIVLDLKPDGYKFLKFKEMVLRLMTSGSYEHTIMIFWEYVLLLEICRKILIDDAGYHSHDHNLREPYQKLQQAYSSDSYISEGDFSERVGNLINKISQVYTCKYGDKTEIELTNPQITELIYEHDITRLREELSGYLIHKDALWILIDNLDKGWPTHGIDDKDLMIIRTLLEATRKIERLFRKKSLEAFTIVFLRNDVYELLIDATPDRGKETKVLIDWTDADMLKELIRRRIVYNGIEEDKTFEEIWPSICISHFEGEETFQYLVDRSLMRPRFLINLINHCKSFAVNLKHEKIQSDDIVKGLSAYSNDVISDISYEIRDVYPEAEDIIYEFIGADKVLSEEALITIISSKIKELKNIQDVIRILIWHGFVGIHIDSKDPMYIYNSNYNMKIIISLLEKKRNNNELAYSINPAFWPALYID